MENELKKFRSYIDDVINSTTKADSKSDINKMKMYSMNLISRADSYTAGKIRQVVNYAILAAGQSKDKELHLSNLERAWYLVESELFAKYDS
ncbi:hypothetical protein C0W80_17005 [Photobacterium leiognathi subsp. mandapamensis]|uniref:hypothetical protein n=1 Tax=Photobacterium leiognathi TaxID=553611 RepID=UPI000D15DD6A|nr:hypothetical protein [Photobacterium leiognathi]PSU96306.1 hypothetical protein C0W80_17005 [Photobacterium leiognathi subsp. mandapamensis]